MNDKHQIGNIRGEYRTHIASRVSANRRKSLDAVITIEEDHGWYMRFEVSINGSGFATHNLATAIRGYNEEKVPGMDAEDQTD
jgi:hypothetical protein